MNERWARCRGARAAAIVGAGLIVLALTACGDDDAAESSADQPTTPATAPTNGATTTTTAPTTTTRPEPPAGYGPLPDSGPVAGGQYAPATFEFPIAFTLGSGWSVLQELPKGLTLLRAPEPDDQALTFDVTIDGDTPQERVEFLISFSGFTSSEIVDTTLFGLPGVTARVTAEALLDVPTLAEHYQVKEGDVLQIYALDADGTTLTVLVEASAANFDAFAAEAQAVLDSVILPPW